MSFKDNYRSKATYIRIPFVLLSWFAIVGNTAMIEHDSFKYFTFQTSTFVAIWLTLSILFKDGLQNENHMMIDKLYGFFKGAFTAYITFTCIIFFYFYGFGKTIGWQWWFSIINHYVVAIFFIFDWFMTERKHYPIKYPLYWLIYPVLYALFAYFYQIGTGDPIYDFLNIDENGFGGFMTWVVILFFAFGLFCFIYYFLNNKVLVKETKRTAMNI